MKTGLGAILTLVLSMSLVLPEASALTPRLDFNDNHYTYLDFGEIRVCGDHICKAHEWDQWMAQLMQNQLKNGGAIPQARIPTGSSTSQSGPQGSGADDSSSGKISRITTFDMGNNEYSSFVPISYNGYLEINHIVVSQKSPGISILRAWIEPQWSSNVESDHVTFDSKDTALYHDKIINVVIVTNGNPTFSLDTLSSNQ